MGRVTDLDQPERNPDSIGFGQGRLPDGPWLRAGAASAGHPCSPAPGGFPPFRRQPGHGQVLGAVATSTGGSARDTIGAATEGRSGLAFLHGGYLFKVEVSGGKDVNQRGDSARATAEA